MSTNVFEIRVKRGRLFTYETQSTNCKEIWEWQVKFSQVNKIGCIKISSIQVCESIRENLA